MSSQQGSFLRAGGAAHGFATAAAIVGSDGTVTLGDNREGFMERRAFLQLLCVGVGTVAAMTPTKALTLVAPLDATHSSPRPAPEPSVAKSEDMDRVQVENAYYGHARRVNRRVSRRVCIGRRHRRLLIYR